ncbi:MAG TPA: Na(+)/H(+) antiporter subunit D [Longimicrobiales bacterium]|nr:Na(+)/H(+) antiporter subunit D [Longimicrobiales bacterium]
MTTSLLLHPVLPFVVAAALAAVAGPMGRRLVSLAAPLAALAMLVSLPDGATAGFSALGHDWVLLRADGLGRVFAMAFILYAFIASIFAWSEEGAGPKVAAMALCGAGVGVVLAGDLLSLFFFWEWLTVASLFLLWFGNTPGSWAAGFRYLVFHLAGATVMLMGILMQMAEGNTAFTAMPATQLSAWLILAGMVTNAAVPPLHAWLSDAYPRASVFGTVFLAAFTTKAAVYALSRAFAGTEILVWGGTIMALFGVVYAVLENDIRRLLTYHIISQVGYMVAGVGLGTALALNGASAHAFSHIFYKGLLMMSAGAVIYATGRGKLTELGHLAGPLKLVLIFMMIGAFSISGVPFFNGFVSKSMIVSAAAYSERAPIEFLLLVASMGTFLHTGLKLPWFTFFGKDQGARVIRDVPTSMYVAMGLAAIVCFVTGVLPGPTLYALLPFDATYAPFTAHHFLESLQLLTGTALGFWLLRVKLGGEPTTTIDIDSFYRQPILWTVDSAGALFEGIGARAKAGTGAVIGGSWGAMQGFGRRYAHTPLAVQSFVIVGVIALVGLAVILTR